MAWPYHLDPQQPTSVAPRIVLCLALGSLLSCSDRVTERYVTGTQAREHRAYDRGLVPGVVPGSATGIVVTHDTDSGAVWLRFGVPENDVSRFRASLRSVGWSSAREGAMPPPFGFGAWHPVLGQSLLYTPEASSTYFVLHERGEWHGVFVPASGLAFMYRLAGSV
jgi:hypothetical protein